MQRSTYNRAKNVCDQLFMYKNHHQQMKIQLQQQNRPCDVFINHRGIDTKKNVAGLLYHHLKRYDLNPFLDSKNMKPGDKLFDKINVAIHESKVCIAVLSPNYCKSYFCLHELALMMDTGKKLIPVFCDVKPSELRVNDNGSCSPEEMERFRRALEEVKLTVGLTFDTSNGDWPEFLASASDAVMMNLLEDQQDRIFKKNLSKL